MKERQTMREKYFNWFWGWRTYLSVAVVLCVLLCAGGCGVRQKTIIFNEHLDETALVLDGREYPLRAFAFYVAYEEQIIQEQALLYDAENPNAYWNTHMNGHFVRIRARTEAMNLAIHDFILYELAVSMGMKLDGEQTSYAKSRCDDFWMDIGEDAQKRLGVTKEEIEETLLHMALAQTYQELIAAMDDVPVEDYDAQGAAYERLLEEHTFKIRASVWEGISMGHVTLLNE